MQIGDFSKLSFVTVKALRYYDEIGLLKPVQVDSLTGYRYYSAAQLPRLNRIVALKNLGLSLEEIARLLKDDVPVASILDLLHAKQIEIKQRLGAEAERLSRVEKWLAETEKEGKMPDYEIVVKKVKPQKAISIRRILPTYADIKGLFEAIGPYLGKVHAPVKGPPIALYHDPEFKETDADVEVAFPLWKDVKTDGEFKMVELLGSDSMASVTYKGSYDKIGEAYSALMRWVETNNYHLVGPTREIYLTDPAKTEPSDYVTEVQAPVGKN